MPVSWRIDEGVAFLESDAGATVEDWKTAIDALLAHPAWVPGTGLVHDRRRLRRTPDVREVRAAVDYASAKQAAIGRARWAIVVSSPAGYGMARVGEALLDTSHIRLRTFYDLDSAEAWVRGAGTA
jgi:hypothetical protein